MTRTEELLQTSSYAMVKAREFNARGDSFQAIEALIVANVALTGAIEEMAKG